MSDRPYNVLFLCTGNSARSILAESILRKDGAGRFNAFSAGSHAKGKINSFSIKVLEAYGYPTDGGRSKGWDEFARAGAPELDFVFTVCDSAAGEACPIWPGQPMTAHWGIEDPAAVEGTDVQKEAAFNLAFQSQEPHFSIHKSADPEPRQDGPRDEASGDRADGRRQLEKAEGELIQDGGALTRRLAAEALGTAFLVAAVVGSGVMAETLTKDTALALLGNTLPTGAILVVLITIFAPISGAHFNPAVSLVFWLRRELPAPETALYTLAQILGGIAGTIAAHLMFALPLVSVSLKARTGAAQWFAEWVATFGLIVTILAGIQFVRASVPWLVGLYITAAYWFTASTSFANPAVAIARSVTNTFSGIRPVDLPGFIVAQLFGAVCGLAVTTWLLRGATETSNANAEP